MASLAGLLKDRGFKVTGSANNLCVPKTNPGVAVMESAQDGERFDAPGPLNRARNPRILVQ